MVKKNGNFYIRGMTSESYNNYDNRIAIYITLLALHKYGRESNSPFSVSEIFMSESSMRIFFEQPEPVIIPGLGKIFMGAVLCNGEIRDRRVTLELRYSLEDMDSEFRFSMVPPLKEAVTQITHTMKPENAKMCFLKLSKIHQKQMKMLEFVTMISVLDLSDKNNLYPVFKKVVSEKDLKAETRNSIQNLYDNELIDNTISIVSFFDRCTKLIDDIDERLNLERVYYKVLSDIIAKQKAEAD